MVRRFLCFLALFLSLSVPAHSAIDFISTSSQYLDASVNVCDNGATNFPCTICAWIRPAEEASDDTVWWVGDTGTTDTHYFRIRKRSTAGSNVMEVRASDAIAQQSTNSTAGYTVDVWGQVCAVITAADNRTVYWNGGNSGNGTTSITPLGVDHVCIGASCNGTSFFFDGDIAEVAVWHSALTAGNISSLYTGALQADCIDSGNLVFYWPLTDNTDLTDQVSSQVLTANATPASATHPTINGCAASTRRPITPIIMNYIEPEGLSIWQSIQRSFSQLYWPWQLQPLPRR